MAYSAPELLLVGAAQNLVLVTSPIGLKGTTACAPGPRDVDLFEDPPEYDQGPTW